MTTDVMLSVLRRETLRAARSPGYLLLALAAPLAFDLLYTATGLAGAADGSIAGTGWASYFMVSMATLGAIVAAAVVGGGTAARPNGPGRHGSEASRMGDLTSSADSLRRWSSSCRLSRSSRWPE